MSIKSTSIFFSALIFVGWMGFSMVQEPLVQSSTITAPAAASLPRPGSPVLHDLATQPRYPLENRTTVN